MLQLATGTLVLDRYQILAPPRATTTGGAVALAVDRRLARRVDLVVAAQPIGTPAGDLLARRAEVVALLRHPALPLVLDMGLHNGHSVLVYRHVEGPLLADIPACERTEWTTEHVVQIVAPIAGALGVAHAQGLCHGALGPRSVLLGPGGATIRDLAYPALAVGAATTDLAPELRRGEGPTPRADVFALGRLLWYVACGRDGGGAHEAADGVREIARRATAWDPRERYADGAALARAIESAALTAPARGASRRATYAGGATRRPAPAAAGPAAAGPAAAGLHPATRAPRPAHEALVALAATVALGLLPLVALVGADGHMPFGGFRHHAGWNRSWPFGQQPDWRRLDPDRAWAPHDTVPSEDGP